MIIADYNYKKGKMMLRKYIDYRKSKKVFIRECYKNPSIAKLDAEANIIKFAYDNGAYTGRVLSYNTSIFTYGFIGLKDGREIFVYITPYRMWWCYLSDLY